MSKFLVGITGAQGAGKTTLLNELASRLYRVDNFKVSRTIQEKMGWSDLKQVLSSPSTMMDFQQQVLEAKLKNDYRLKQQETEHIILTERTFADICAYTMSWCWQLVDAKKWSFNEASKFLTPFTKECISAQKDCYNAVIILPFMKHVALEEDRHRASASTIDTVFEDMENFLSTRELLSTLRFTINTKTVEERANQVQIFLRGLNV